MGSEDHSPHMTAADAALFLGVKAATIYAYVSRGLIRSERIGPGRERRYRRDDVLRLKRRAEVRADPGSAARHAFEHSAAPILDSSITLIAEQELYYRGHPVTALARTHSFEQVVALLWCGDLEAPVAELAKPVLPFVERTWVQSAGRPLAPWFAFQSVLPRLAAADPAAEDLNPAAVRRTGARILLAHVACLERIAATERLPAPPGGRHGDADPAGVTGEVVARSPAPAQGTAASDPAGAPGGMVARSLARAWGAAAAVPAAAVIESALVLLADHELNVSTMAARTAASGRASPYHAVLAGLAAAHGTLHGQASMLVSELLRTVARPQRARRVVGEYLRSRRPLPGFGHRVYRTRDPRAAALLRHLHEAAPGHPALEVAEAVAEAVREMVTDAPVNVDLSLAALVAVLGLPASASETLFIVARTAGWIAHALEQYRTGGLLRPRARYVGPVPDDGG